MINTVPLYCTVDNYRLHIADWNSNYGGSINSYNNFLTRFFTKLFRISTDLEINGKNYVVNKDDYKKFLESHQITQVESNKNFNQIFAKYTLNWSNRQKMSTHLSQSKTTQLFRKLAHALCRKNFDKAYKLAGQGADLNQHFWERGAWNISFENIDTNLPQQPLDFEATRYSPLLYVAKHQQSNLIKFFHELSANARFMGETWKFNRYLAHKIVQNTLHETPILKRRGFELVPTGRSIPTQHTITTNIYEDLKTQISTFTI